MSTLESFTSSSYEPYAAQPVGMLTLLINFSALALEEDEATAVTECVMSFVPRLVGSLSRSLTKTAFF